VKEFNVEKFPGLVVLPGGSVPGIVYTGDMERDPLFNFLSENAQTPSPTASPVVPKRHESTGRFSPTIELIEVDYTPKKITEISELWETCFTTPGTCYLLLSPNEDDLKTLATINQRLNAKMTVRIFTTDLLEGKEIVFDGTVPRMIALNGGKGWYKRFDGSIVERDVAEWMDAVKMGEGKKISMPKGEEMMKLFGLFDFGTSTSASSTTTSVSETPIEAVTKDTTSTTSSVYNDDIKEVFSDEKENVHDEL